MLEAQRKRRASADIQKKKGHRHTTSSTSTLHELHPFEKYAESHDKGNHQDVPGCNTMFKKLKRGSTSQSLLNNPSSFRINECERPKRRKTNHSVQSALSSSPNLDLSDDEEEILRFAETQRKSLCQKSPKTSRSTVFNQRKGISLAVKVEVLAFAEMFSERETAVAFDISKTTVNDIKKSKEEIMALYEVSKSCGTARCRRIRKTSFEEVNIKTWKWFLQRLKMPGGISNKELREEALSIAKEAGVKNFTASNGWISSFKERFGITLSRSEVSVKNPTSVSAYLEAKELAKNENEQPPDTKTNRTPVHMLRHLKNIPVPTVPLPTVLSVDVQRFGELLL